MNQRHCVVVKRKSRDHVFKSQRSMTSNLIKRLTRCKLFFVAADSFSESPIRKYLWQRVCKLQVSLPLTGDNPEGCHSSKWRARHIHVIVEIVG